MKKLFKDKVRKKLLWHLLWHTHSTQWGAALIQTPGGMTEESPQVSVTDQRRRGHTVGSKMTEEGDCLSPCLCVFVSLCVGGDALVSLWASDLGSEDISAKREHFVSSSLQNAVWGPGLCFSLHVRHSVTVKQWFSFHYFGLIFVVLSQIIGNVNIVITKIIAEIWDNINIATYIAIKTASKVQKMNSQSDNELQTQLESKTESEHTPQKTSSLKIITHCIGKLCVNNYCRSKLNQEISYINLVWVKSQSGPSPKQDNMELGTVALLS